MIPLCIREVLTPVRVIFGCFARFVQKRKKKVLQTGSSVLCVAYPYRPERADYCISKAYKTSC